MVDYPSDGSRRNMMSHATELSPAREAKERKPLRDGLLPLRHLRVLDVTEEILTELGFGPGALEKLRAAGAFAP
jgi:hypothetical protein